MSITASGGEDRRRPLTEFRMPGLIGGIATREPAVRAGIIVLLLGLALLRASPSPAGALVSFEPRVTLVDPANVFDVVIGIDAGVDTVSTFHVIFEYDPAVIEFQTALEGSLYTSTGNQTWFGYLESSPGTVEVYDVIFPALSFILPPGELATVRFRALADGISPLHFIAVPLVADINRDSLPDTKTADGTIAVGSASTGIPGGTVIDRGWVLGNPRPNPARGESRITFRRLPSDLSGSFVFGVFDLSGRLVRNLESVPIAAASELFWDGRDDKGAEVSPGVYFFRLETAGESISRKVIVVR